MRSPPTSRLPALAFKIIAFLLAALLTNALSAQPMGVIFADHPLELDSVGLTMSVPLGSTIEAGARSSTIAATIRPARDPWLITIQTPTANSSKVTPSSFIDEIIAEIQRRYGTIKSVRNPVTGLVELQIVDTRATVLSRIPALRLGGLDADRVYLSMPVFGGSTGEQEIRGYTVVKSTPTQFIVFELICPASSRLVTTMIYETIVATARFADPRAIESSRGKALNKGLIILDQLTPAHYDRALALNADRWERLYLPSPTGSPSDRQDIGYRHIRAWRGPRGQLNPAKPAELYDEIEKTEGYLLSMQVRLVGPSFDGRGFDISDTRAIFFMTPDGSDEAWNIQMTRRDDHAALPETFLEIGARTGLSMRVVVEGPGIASKTIRPILQGSGYIAQVQAYLLPSLLPQLGITDEFAFYAYRSAEEAIILRRIRLDHPGGNTSRWRITTTFGEGETPQIAYYKLSGELIRAELPGDRVWAPTTLEELVRLWRTQGLPMD